MLVHLFENYSFYSLFGSSRQLMQGLFHELVFQVSQVFLLFPKILIKFFCQLVRWPVLLLQELLIVKLCLIHHLLCAIVIII